MPTLLQGASLGSLLPLRSREALSPLFSSSSRRALRSANLQWSEWRLYVPVRHRQLRSGYVHRLCSSGLSIPVRCWGGRISVFHSGCGTRLASLQGVLYRPAIKRPPLRGPSSPL